MTPTTLAEKFGFALVLAVVGFSVWVSAEAAQQSYGLSLETAVLLSVGAVVLAMGLTWLIIARLHSALRDRIRKQSWELEGQPIAPKPGEPPAYSPSRLPY
jgi:hypothetical protein